MSLVLLVMHMCRLDERVTARGGKKASGRVPHRVPRPVFAHVYEHEDGVVRLIDPDGKVTRRRRRRG